MTARSTALLCALGAVALSGCGASSLSVPATPRPSNPCVAADSAAPARDTLRITLLEPVDAGHAPIPVNDAERLVFRQLYETLVRVDCRGDVVPGLAVQWREEDGGRRWLFALADGARFWDGTPVDAAAVRGSWSAVPTLPVVDVQPWGNHGLAVSLAAPRTIGAFGDLAWSVVKRIPESAWPVGTGPVWAAGWTPRDDTRILRATPTPMAPPGTPVLVFRQDRGANPRDALDQRAEVIVTRDAGAVRYARGRDDWRDVPLSWDRVYVLASPVRLHSGTTALLDAAAQRALAGDAVRDEARAPATTPWWDPTECDLPGDAPRPGPLPRPSGAAVAAPAGDRVASDLVARLVARPDAYLHPVLGDAVHAPIAAPLEATDFAAQLAEGRALAFVTALPRQPADRCGAVTDLWTRVPWLRSTATPSSTPLVPLVETRAHLLLRDVPLVTLDGDGGVRLVPARHP